MKMQQDSFHCTHLSVVSMYLCERAKAATLTATVPSSLSISPSRAESSEDFPEPTCPTTATREPSGIDTLSLWTHRDIELC